MAEQADSNDAKSILRRHAAAVEPALIAAVSATANVPPRLAESITYSLAAGGKRLRPALVLECARACGGRAEDRSALAAAVAMELVHTFSLVHDDLPAMDDDDLRRGVPTNHKVFGEAMAILAGDAMVTLAFEVLATSVDAALVPALVRELAIAAGPAGMIGGQVLDIAGEGRSLELPELQQIHRLKTGALLTAACRMGAIAAGAGEPQLAAISEYGRHLGLAFQIVDDLLDVTSTPQQLGKQTNKDASSGKNTYPRLLGIEASRAAAAEHVEASIHALAEFGPPADGLRAMARFVTARST
ncbi:MAG: geranylgeranyl diphosphate synthase, type [Phycisphaerales bacterium]|nr:geranylgeranyl diphosphate synthase, type [Phycisphaerales bacterium]